MVRSGHYDSTASRPVQMFFASFSKKEEKEAIPVFLSRTGKGYRAIISKRKRNDPVKQENKGKIIRIAICVFLFLLAGFLQWIDSRLPLFWHRLCGLSAHAIFLSLLLYWCALLRLRIVDQSTRRYLTLAGFLLVLWLLFRWMKYDFVPGGGRASRYLWYLYYLPQCFAPLLGFYASFGLLRKKNRPIPWPLYLLYIAPTVLVVLILTNDFHQLAFRFPHGLENAGDDYYFGPVAYLAITWFAIMTLSCIALFFYRCGNSAARKRMGALVISTALLAGFGAVCFLLALDSYKVPEIYCFGFLLFFEVSIQIGLIPANDNDAYYYSRSHLDFFLMGKDQKVHYASCQELPSSETIQKALEEKECFEGSIRLRSHSISGGTAFYAEDLSSVLNLLEERKNLNRELEEQRELLAYENSLKEKRATAEEKNRIYDEVNASIQTEADQTLKILKILQEKPEEFEKGMRDVCVLASFMKRRANLKLLASQKEDMDIQEVEWAIQETLKKLENEGILTALLSKAHGLYPSPLCVALFTHYEALLRSFYPKSGAIFCTLSGEGNSLSLSIQLSCFLPYGDLPALPDIPGWKGQIRQEEEDGGMIWILSYAKEEEA